MPERGRRARARRRSRPRAAPRRARRARASGRRGCGTRRSRASPTVRPDRVGVHDAARGADPPRDDVGHRDVDALALAGRAAGGPTPRTRAARTPCRPRGRRPAGAAPRPRRPAARARRRAPGS